MSLHLFAEDPTEAEALSPEDIDRIAQVREARDDARWLDEEIAYGRSQDWAGEDSSDDAEETGPVASGTAGPVHPDDTRSAA